jgi:DDE superfamily endonuclease
VKDHNVLALAAPAEVAAKRPSAPLLETLLELLQGWAPAFRQRRTWARAIALALGLLCGWGRRTLTCALCFWDRQHQDWSAAYKLFSRSRWEPHALFTPVLQRAIQHYCPRHIPIGLDDTRLKRWGRKIPNAFWGRDPMSPPFRANLLWGQRFLQASLLAPLYHLDGQSGPRGLPVRFEEVPAVRKPGKKASPEAWAAYRRAQKAHNLSTAFVAMVQDLRRGIDAQGFAHKTVIAVGDGSFCNQTTFRQGFERTVLITRARKNLRLCFPYQGPGRRVYGPERFTPEEVYKDTSRPWKEVRLFHGGKYRRVRYKEVSEVLWRRGGLRRRLRLLVLAPTAYRKTKAGRPYYREKAFLLCDDTQLAAKALLQAYFDRWEIEVNHRDEKSILGVGQAQVWAPLSAPRVPALLVAAYSLLLLSALEAHGPQRTHAYEALPAWRRSARRPSCQDLVTLLRKQVTAQRDRLSRRASLAGYPKVGQPAAA